MDMAVSVNARRALIALFTIALPLALACGSSETDDLSAQIGDETCRAITAKLDSVGRAQLAKLSQGSPQYSMLKEHLLELRKQYGRACQNDAWPESSKTCLANAASAEAFDACARELAAHVRDSKPGAKPTATPSSDTADNTSDTAADSPAPPSSDTTDNSATPSSDTAADSATLLPSDPASGAKPAQAEKADDPSPAPTAADGQSGDTDGDHNR